MLVGDKRRKHQALNFFKPTSLGGNKLWLDDPAKASNITEDGSNKVSQWFDISGNSNNFPQATGLDQGTRTGRFIEYDGVRQFQDGSGVLASFASDAQGELFIVAHELEGAGALTTLFAGGLASATTDFLRFNIGAGDVLGIAIRIGGSTNNIAFTNAAPRSQKALYNFRSSGTAYGGQVNGVEDTVASGTDNGDWFADVPALDTLAISATIRSASLFFNNRIYSIVYYNRELTATERLNVSKFLNQRFNIGLSL